MEVFVFFLSELCSILLCQNVLFSAITQNGIQDKAILLADI